jgi:serine/threonine-protein kinase RsbW
MQTLEINAVRENYAFLVEAIEAFLAAEHVDREDAAAILVASEEVFINIVDHGYGQNGGTLTLRLSRAGGRVRMTYIDAGVPFNPLELPAPDIDLPLDRRRAGGLGLMIVRKLMDSVAYERRDGKNHLTLVKTVRQPTVHSRPGAPGTP